MNSRIALSFLMLWGLAPVSAAAQPLAAETPPLPPDSAGLSLEPRYLAAAADAWDDYADRWRYRSNLSLWAAGIEGTIGKGEFLSDVDASFADLFDKLTIGLGLDSEIRKGPFAVILFGQYQHFEADAETPRGFDGDAKADFAFVDVALAYRVLHLPGGAPGSGFSVEALAGFRWTYLSMNVEINDGPLAGRDEDREKNWFDPYAGARLRYDFDRRWNVSAMGTVGGFGVGSDFAWSAYGQLEYRFDAKFSFILGYRAISYDYEDDGFVFDVTLHGPVIGLGIRL